MNTAKVLVATFFATLFMMAMPVHADWESHITVDKMMDEKKIYVFTDYEENNKKFHLAARCKFEDFALMGNNVFISDIKYEDRSNDNELLIRFDKEPAYYIKNVRAATFEKGSGFVIRDNDFLSKIKKHQTLLVKIHLQSDDFIIAEFDISGFNEAYEKHCR